MFTLGQFGRATTCGTEAFDYQSDVFKSLKQQAMVGSQQATSAAQQANLRYAEQQLDRTRKLYADGTATRWQQQVTDFFVRFGNIQNPVPASTYFDARLFMDTVKA